MNKETDDNEESSSISPEMIDQMAKMTTLSSTIWNERGESGSLIGSSASEMTSDLLESYFGPEASKYIGDMVGDMAEEYVGGKNRDDVPEEDSSSEDEEGGEGGQQQDGGSEGGQDGGSSGGGGGGGCSKGSRGCGDYSSSDGQCHKTPKPPYFKLEIEENNLPENWWDKLPDFDPRVYDAISMEQAAACVNYIFDGLPDMHELENKMEARKNPKTCPRLKTNVPRTKIIKPKEIKCEVPIDSFIDKGKTY